MSGKVSIIIPCYNDGKYLPEAVASAKAQTYPDIEIIIVDDHSTDTETQKVLQRAAGGNVVVVKTPEGKKGLPAARNTGISVAGGDYILPLDADDTIYPTYVEKTLAVLEGNPDVAVCGSGVRFFGLRHNDWQQPEYSATGLVLEEFKLVCTALYRRRDWERVGGYDESLTLGKEDMVFWLDMLQDGRRIVILPEVLFFYRIKPNSMTAATGTGPTERDRLTAMYAARPEVFQRHTLDFMELCARYRDEKARLTCLVSWNILSPLFRLEWRIRQRIKRWFGRA
ncbi:hypothetical protein KL86DPRO_70102 [uncultured delta proteobacterium]|uniref:Glycosyltransferase 2-like domain-containing protein n=1 Tax=uncultured delta proteobacterium TaxID=34034 RepID=A0A212KHA7_9DELT|nr:hypothetical protein KL86DPRO_70102 [uncultured delta proteobacterium]